LSEDVVSNRAGAVEAPALAVSHLSKSFGGAQALRDVSFSVAPGEVHGLLGQNGSGKSTLIKILAGYHVPDPGGRLEIHGRDVPLPLDPGQFRELGLSFVHQDLGLIPSLTVLENLIVGTLASERRLRIDWRAERRRARALFERFSVELDPRATVADLSQVDRALLAIVRAVDEFRHEEAELHAKGVLVLDEPTVFLPKNRTERLFALVRQIAEAGASVIFVSHDLDEVRQVTDRITVLRDGRVVGTAVTSETDEQALVEMIIGRRLAAFTVEHHDLADEEIALAVEGLDGEIVRGLSLDARQGEIVGLTGLVGSGFDEVLYLLFGAAPATAGTVTLDGTTHELPAMTPHRALACGIALVPADRPGAGSVGSLSTADNVMLLMLDRYRTGPLLHRRRMAADGGELLRRFDVQPALPDLPYEALSGGNQQKAMLAKWLQTTPSLVLFDEPTQGVDVGARQQIYTIVREAAEAGAVVLCASSDFEQLATLCDRVVVFGRGRVVRQLTGNEMTKDRIAEQCYNSLSLADALTAST